MGATYLCYHLKVLGVDVTGGMQEYWAVPSDRLLKLPDAVSDHDAALIEPLAVAKILKAEAVPPKDAGGWRTMVITLEGERDVLGSSESSAHTWIFPGAPPPWIAGQAALHQQPNHPRLFRWAHLLPHRIKACHRMAHLHLADGPEVCLGGNGFGCVRGKAQFRLRAVGPA